MLKILTRPSFLLPFSLVSPYLFFGLVGITGFELLLLGILFFRFIVMGRPIPKKNIIVVYAILLLAGYGIALINGALKFGLPVGTRDLKVFYWLVLAYAGFYVGYRHYEPLTQIANARPVRLIILGLCIFVISYPFLSSDMRMLIMRPFYSPEIDPVELRRIEQPRFPGLGVNANTFAFMTLVFYVVMLREWLAKRLTWVYPALLALSLAVMSSKTVVALAAMLSLHLVFFSSRSMKSKLYVAIGTALVVSGGAYFLFFTEQGAALQGNIVIIDRFIRLTEARDIGQESPVDVRVDTWQRGLERVGLAPLAGIPRTDRTNELELLDFCCPHNEFIAYWTFTGLLGLLAYLSLIGYLIKKNLSTPNWAFWSGLYFALCVQMFFDSAFQAPRFIPFMFMVFGLNLRELDRQ